MTVQVEVFHVWKGGRGLEANTPRVVMTLARVHVAGDEIVFPATVSKPSELLTVYRVTLLEAFIGLAEPAAQVWAD